MKRHGNRYTEEQIIRILKESETGKAVAEVCREYGIAEGTLYRWRQKFGGMEVSEAKRLKVIEGENTRLKRVVAQQAMDIDALKELLSKKW
jgi:putative transposase